MYQTSRNTREQDRARNEMEAISVQRRRRKLETPVEESTINNNNPKLASSQFLSLGPMLSTAIMIIITAGCGLNAAEEISISRLSQMSPERRLEMFARASHLQKQQQTTESSSSESQLSLSNSTTGPSGHQQQQLTKRQIELDQSQPFGEAESARLKQASNSEEAPNRLHIVRLFAPEAVQNGTQNVTIDCMFKFDKKLDQRLTIKWFFNDELEPIYQWIPELNKRVYSDKYEHFLDKSYQVNEDVDFMLQAYKWLLQSPAGAQNTAPNSLPSSLSSGPDSHQNNALSETPNPETYGLQEDPQGPTSGQQHPQQVARGLLASRLSRLAKLGSENSRQLLATLRANLAMQNDHFSRFRALRLIRPTGQLSGRFTCSISSLDGDDLQAARLIVYEPAKRLDLSVSRVTANLLNLTCSASRIFPRPTLSLFRQAASNKRSGGRQLGEVASSTTSDHQEPLEPLVVGVQTQLVLLQQQQQQQTHPHANAELAASNEILPTSMDHELQLLGERTPDGGPAQVLYEISAWTLVDEATLASDRASKFECLLNLEGTPNHEQRQAVTLHKGWPTNSQQLPALGLARNSTLVGLLGALAALLCLLVALVSAGLIFRLLRRQPLKRPRVRVADSAQVISVARPSGKPRSNSSGNEEASEAGSASSATSTTNASGTQRNLLQQQQPKKSESINRPGSDYNEFGLVASNNDTDTSSVHQFSPAVAARRQLTQQSEGVYRVPASLAKRQQQQQQQQPLLDGPKYDNNQGPFNLANRLVIGGAGRWPSEYGQQQQQYNAWNQLQLQQQQQPLDEQRSANKAQFFAAAKAQQQQQQQQSCDPPSIGAHHSQATISVNGKQLYC